MSIIKQEIQIGSNLFELIEFTVTKNKETKNDIGVVSNNVSVYGVNVAKVREVIRLPHIVPCLTKNPEVLGVFNLRGIPIPAIHLAKTLGYPDEPINENSQIIVTEFSRRVAGFIVASTKRIRRVSWDKVLPPASDTFSTITGMMLIENSDFLFMLDFEQILLKIEGKKTEGHEQIKNHNTDKNSFNIEHKAKYTAIVVDDSTVARRAVCDILRSLNCQSIEFSNGEEAFNALKDKNFLNDAGKIDFVLSDVEMPKLDGYSLVKKIKNDANLRNIPIILHSSLSGEVNRERGKIVGANAYVSKLNKQEIKVAINDLLDENHDLNLLKVAS